MKAIANTKCHRIQLWGWILFIISALFFITSSIRAGDIMSLMGGVFFLISCIVFMIPLLGSVKPEAENEF